MSDMCPDSRTFCLPDGATSEEGVCVPRDCAPDHLLGCFAGTGTVLERFLAGDCDGDLRTNGEELSGRTSLCDGALVVAFTERGLTWYSGERLDEGDRIAPSDAFSRIPGAFGIGCSGTSPCPRLPRAEAGLRSRCVYLRRVGSEELGVCTYYADPRDDRSCLDGVDANACLEVSAERFESSYGWEEGDCDRDGLINKLDPRVCSELEVIGTMSGGPTGVPVECVDGSVDPSECDGRTSALSPDLWGCAERSDLKPFAFCCDSQADCPIAALESLRPRCVRLDVADSSGEPRGACTYHEVLTADDRSCVGRGVQTTCFAGGEPTGYGSWAAGDCDDCDDTNQVDPFVCDCPAAGEDAGPVDAGAHVETDAAVGPEVDAASAALDGALVDDAAAPEPGFFAGSGCRCAAGRAQPPVATLALFALFALGVRRWRGRAS